MPNNRILLVANSVYQLLTAIHMRCTIWKEREAELIVTDGTPSLRSCLPRLKETGLFSRVIYAAVQELNRRISASSDAIDTLFKEQKRTFEWMLDNELGNYAKVCFANFDLFTRMLANYYYAAPCEFVWYEDGFSSYVIDYLKEERAAINRHPEGRRIQDKVERVFLYEPRLAIRKDRIVNCALPKISLQDTDFRNMLNYIFSYTKPESQEDFIFLEQSFRAEGIKGNDLAFMKECRDVIGRENFLVKPHPRNTENLPYQMGLSRRCPDSVPWELFLLNEGTANKTIITVCSNAALTGRIVFGMDIPTVMLYQLYQGKVLWKEDETLWRYLRIFRNQFAGPHYYVPQTIYELRCILRYLGGCNERR